MLCISQNPWSKSLAKSEDNTVRKFSNVLLIWIFTAHNTLLWIIWPYSENLICLQVLTGLFQAVLLFSTWAIIIYQARPVATLSPILKLVAPLGTAVPKIFIKSSTSAEGVWGWHLRSSQLDYQYFTQYELPFILSLVSFHLAEQSN